jgi:type I restriction enzyme S subunit
MPRGNMNEVKNFPFFYPKDQDQQRIVSRLDALSEHVKALEENQRKVMAECDALKQALLRKVFE